MNTKQHLKQGCLPGTPDSVLKDMMAANLKDAESIYTMSKEQDCLDSQEFIEWQDRLNEISIKYK